MRIKKLNWIFVVLLSSICLCAGQTTQETLDDIADYLVIKYDVITNLVEVEEYTLRLTFNNTGTRAIPKGNWTIYFNSVRIMFVEDVRARRWSYLNGTGLRMKHVDGGLFKLEPTADFSGWAPGRPVSVDVAGQYWLVSQTDGMPQWYVAAENHAAQIIKSTEDESLSFMGPFDTPEQWKRFHYDKYDPYTPWQRYERFAVYRDGEKIVIPTPRNVTVHDGHVITVDFQWQVVCKDIRLKKPCSYLIDNTNMENATDLPSSKYIKLVLSSDVKEEEGYHLTVDTATKSIVIAGSDKRGVFYGVQTLLSLLASGNFLNQMEIRDSPRFSYRGMHIDVGRHFIKKDQMKKIIDWMSRYKLNKLHFHITDDEGWRVEIPGLPELTTVGANQCHDPTKDHCIAPELGSGPFNTSSGSGYFSVAEYKELLKYADDRFIEVIPEIDMPGHCHAAIEAMESRYRMFMAQNNPEEAEKYRLIDPNDTSMYLTAQYFTNNILNPCRNSTFTFIKKVAEELTKLHADIQPLKTFHYGGDEIANGWVNSTMCKKFLETHEVPDGMTEHDVFLLHFIKEVSKITHDLGLNLAAWEDGMLAKDETPYSRDDLVNKEVLAYPWQSVWEWGVGNRAYKLANAGFKVVMSQATHLYFDHPYEPDPYERGYYWATRFEDTKKTFGFLPDNLYGNIDVDRAGNVLTEETLCKTQDCVPLEKPENIIGLQGNLWTETMREPEHVYYMMFPRLIAMAERAWHKAAWESEADDKKMEQLKQEDWEAFARSLGERETKRLENDDIEYRVPPPGARLDGARQLLMMSEMPGLPMQYRAADDTTWHNFRAGVIVTRDLMLRTLSHDRNRPSREIFFNFTEAVDTLNTGIGGGGGNTDAAVSHTSSLSLLLTLVTMLLWRL